MQSKHILRPLFITLGLLLIPLIGNATVDGWNWSPGDFIAMGSLVFAVGVGIETLGARAQSMEHRVGIALALLTMLGMFWVNGAVGIIGDESNFNATYMLLIPFGVLGFIVTRARPLGLSRLLYVMAAIVLLNVCLAAVYDPVAMQQEPGPVGIFMLNVVLASFFAGAGMLCKQAATLPPQGKKA